MGGDTDRRPGPITVSITAVGSVPRGGMVRRNTARPGDAVFVSGTLGDSALGLLLRRNPRLAETWGLTAADAEHLRRRYLRPSPRLGLGDALRGHSASAMDISDGLAKDLARMCSASGCGAQVRLAELPLSPAARKALAADPRLVMAIAAGGDDYEILACVAADKASDFVAAARAAGVEHDPHRHPQRGQRRDLRRRGGCSGLVSLLGLGSLLTRTCGARADVRPCCNDPRVLAWSRANLDRCACASRLLRGCPTPASSLPRAAHHTRGELPPWPWIR